MEAVAKEPILDRIVAFLKNASAVVVTLTVLVSPMVYVGVQLGKADERFTAIDHRFTAVDQRFAAIEKRLDGIDQALEAGRQRDEQMMKSLARIEAILDERLPRRR